MNALSLLVNRYQSLKHAERKVADYIRRRPAEILLMPLQELARETGTSDATILRLCRALGFSGYQDFKSSLIPDLVGRGASVYREVAEVGSAEGFEGAAAGLAHNLGRGVVDTLTGLPREAVAESVELLVAAELVVAIGLAGSGAVGRILADSLLSLGILAQHCSDRVEIERLTDAMSPTGMLVAISHSGESEEVCRGLERARKRGVATLGITNFAPSTLHTLADRTLLTTIPENLLGSYSSAPRIAQLAVVELLVTWIAQRKGVS